MREGCIVHLSLIRTYPTSPEWERAEEYRSLRERSEGRRHGHLMLSGPRERCVRQKVCYQLLSGPGATNDSERYHGQRLLSDPQDLSAYQVSTETGTEMILPVMNAITGRPTVRRTSTGVHEIAALTLVSPSNGAEESRGVSAMKTFTPRVGTAPSESKDVGTSQGWGRTQIVWGQGIPLQLPTIHQTRYLVPAAPPDTTSRLLIAVEPGINTSSALCSVSDALSRLQQEQVHLQKDRDEWKRRYTELHHYYGNIIEEKDD